MIFTNPWIQYRPYVLEASQDHYPLEEYLELAVDILQSE